MHVCVRVCGRVHGGVRFSNSNRIIPSDYRILHLLKMPIPNIDLKCHFVVNTSVSLVFEILLTLYNKVSFDNIS